MFKINVGFVTLCLILCTVTALKKEESDSDYDLQQSKVYYNPLHRTDLIDHILSRSQPVEKISSNDETLHRVKRGWLRRTIRRVGNWFRDKIIKPIRCGFRKLFGWVTCYCVSCRPVPPTIITESFEPPEFEHCPSNMQYVAGAGDRNKAVTWDEQKILNSAKDKKELRSKSLTSPVGVRPGDAFEEGDHTITYTAINSQNLRGYCSFSIKIIVHKCSRIPHPSNGYVTYPNTELSEIPVLGENAQITCFDGFSLDGNSIRTCQSGGTWSDGSAATCTVIACHEPVVPPTLQLRSCSLTNPNQYQSTCIYDCAEGYSRPDDAVMGITCRGADGWDNELLDCIDLTPPEITNCPPDITAILARNSNVAEATWVPPTANDIIDGGVAALLTGQEPNSLFPIGHHRIRYDAEDTSDNSAIPCIFFVTVIELTCPPIVPSYKLEIDCSGFGYGSECTFTCMPGYPIQGSNNATCDLTGGDPPDVFWDYGQNGMPVCTYFECVDLEPPINGASACNSWTYGRFCLMLCQNDWDIPRTAPNDGEWTCSDNTGTWLPTDAFPDCTERSNPRNMVMDSSLYFTGTCGDNEDAIKDLYISKLTGSGYRSYCTNHPECTVENVVVSCGATLPLLENGQSFSNITSSDAFNTGVLITFRFVIEINYPTNWTPADLFDQLDAQFVNMVTQLQAEIAEGLYDMPTLGLTADPSTFVYDWSQLECEAGLVASDNSFSCRMCPTGTKYDELLYDCADCPRGTYQDEAGAFSCKSCPEGTSTLNTVSTNASQCEEMCLPGTFSASGLKPCIPCPMNKYEDSYGSTECIECPDNSTTGGQGSSSVSDCKLHGDCDNDPCNGHTWYEDEHGFNCVCGIGFQGLSCEEEKDPCGSKPCLNGGTCVPDGQCQCPNNTVGARCNVVKEDGGFSMWMSWTSCSASCEDGQQSRIRECNNPVPGNGGMPCGEEFEQTRTCNMGPCPYCDESELEIPDHSSLNCSLNEKGQKVCHVECYFGFMLIETVYNTVTCDVTTRWEWDYDKERYHLPSCVESKIPQSISVRNSFTVPDVETGTAALSTSEAYDDIYNFVANNTLCLRNGTCTLTTEIVQMPGNTKREAASDVFVTFTVEIGFENATFFDNGTFDEGTAYSSIEQLIVGTLDLESMASEFNLSLANETLGVTFGGLVYYPDSESLEQKSSEVCEDPQVSFNGFCVDCPPGSYKYGQLCRMCPLGQYQGEEGQLECEMCPQETTTAYVGARNVSQCFSIHQDVCSPGTYLDGSLCVYCAVGQYQDADGQSYCIDCPMSQYQDLPGQDSCLPCADDESTNQTGSTRKEDCFFDPMICPAGSYETAIECTFCPVGYYQDLPNQYTCKPCPRDHITAGVGSVSEHDCVQLESDEEDSAQASILMIAMVSWATITIVAIVAIVLVVKKRPVKRQSQVSPRLQDIRNGGEGKEVSQTVEADRPPSYDDIQ